MGVNGEDGSGHVTREHDERARRLQELRRISQTSSPAPAERASNIHSRASERSHGAGIAQVASARRRQLRVAAGILIAALIVTVAIVLAHSSYPQATSTPSEVSASPHSLPITPQADGVACASGAAWSPDGSAIAVVGYETECPSSDIGVVNVPGKLAIYQGDKMQAGVDVTLPLDVISHQIGVALPVSTVNVNDPALPTILFSAPIWSPHGKRIEIPFVVRPTCFCLQGQVYQFNERGAPLRVGLLELSATGHLSSIMSVSYDASNQQSSEWDTQRHALVVTTAIVPAQTYTWNGARLTPTSPLDAHPTLGSIGDPQRAASFSIWQSGWGGAAYRLASATPASDGTAASPGQPDIQRVPGLFTLTPTLAAWSPDGRYLIIPTFSALIMRLPGAPPLVPAAVSAAGLSDAPQVTPRDAGLVTLYNYVLKGGIVPPYALAWSPDGALLAAAQDLPGDEHVNEQPLTLLDTRSGKVVATLLPAANPQYQMELNPTMLSPIIADSASYGTEAHPQVQWSPDGSRLFLLNPVLGTITIWTVKAH